MAGVVEKEIFKELCENDFSFFCKQFLKIVEPETHFEWNWHMDALCYGCEAVYYGTYQNLDIQIPPRMLKSLIISVLYPTWCWTKTPSMKFLCASRSFDLSVKFNQQRRDLIQSREYTALWPIVLKEDQNTTHKFANYHRGFMQSVSAGGKVTGEGADCFEGSTLVETDQGPMSIEKLHDLARISQVKVLSINHESGNFEYKRVKKTRRTKSNNIVRTSFSNGSVITSTSDHKFFTVGRGYEPIFDPQGFKEKRFVSLVRNQDKSDLLHGLPEVGQNPSGEISMRPLQFGKDGFTSGHGEEGAAQLIENLLLLDKMQNGISEPKGDDGKFMRDMRAADCKENGQRDSSKKDMPELPRVGAKFKQKDESNRDLSNLPESIQEIISAETLLGCLQSGEPIEANDRTNQGVIGRQDWELLFQHPIEEDTKPDKELLRLRTEREFAGSSYRLGLQKQQSGESCGSLRILPHNSPQDQRPKLDPETKITLQEQLSAEIDVYDIEVEDNHNFFANGLLVHNCLLSDDLLDAIDAFSKAKREAACLWYSNAFYNRAQNKKKVKRINVNQRLHQKDISGHLEENHNFERLVLPMIKMKDDLTTIEFKDPRQEGEYLFPARYGQEEMEDDYKGLGVYGWSAQYQQTPRPIGGGIIKEEWIRYYDVLPNIERKIITADLTFKGTSKSDYVSFQCWGISQGKKYLIDLVRGKWSYKESKDNFVTFCNKNNAQNKYIEDKANGPALISDLKDVISGLRAWPEAGSKFMNADKVQRLHLCSQDYEMGEVYLPNNVVLVDKFVEELTSFTEKGSATGNDDMVDTSTMALLQLRRPKTFFSAG